MARWLTVGRTHRFGFLLAAMCAELILAPVIRRVTDGVAIARALTVVVLLAALVAVRARRIAVGLFALALLAHMASSWSPSPIAEGAAAASRLIFLCYVFARIVHHVLGDRAVTLDTIAGSACAYMLLGLIWGALYFLVERWHPGSFVIPSTYLDAPGIDLQASLTYFSYVTLTTLGYGVIHPADAATGGLCVAEAIVGQLFLAVMVARMVGLHTAQRSS